MKKIIFILSNIYDPHALKRIEEFRKNGYEVEAFGFSRRKNTKSEAVSEIGYVGEKTYVKRLPIIYNGIKNVLSSISKETTVLYLFGLDVALVAHVLSGKSKYIYEECDLAHTYVNNSIVRKLLEIFDKKLVKKSLLTVFTSEGFANYHFGEKLPDNIKIITNRLDEEINNCPKIKENEFDINHIKIGFVGMIRFKSIFSFSSYFISHYPQHEFHFFGRIDANQVDAYKQLEAYSNCHFHGAFKSPVDLPEIYSQIDLVLSTYDVECENVCYAEPNKLYESLYFETPIIVSEGTFLEKRVKDLNSGYSVDPLNPVSIDNFISNLTEDDYNKKRASIKMIPKEYSINYNEEFFKVLSRII